MFVATKHNYAFCRDKHVFVATKHNYAFCRDKHVFVATKIVVVADPDNDTKVRKEEDHTFRVHSRVRDD